jgi:glycosyltransferase involved in cell wall biosynthesis
MTTLGVFFTRGVSLKKWLDGGLLDREVTIYRQHLLNGALTRVFWFTYGADDDCFAEILKDAGRLPPEIDVVPCPRWILKLGRSASALYSLLMPFVIGSQIRRCDLLKTNQMDGALAAVVASRLYGRPLFVRTGYTLSRIVAEVFPGNPLRLGTAWLTERLAFQLSARASVSSQYDLEYVTRKYGLGGRLPVVIGNFVDTAAFAPAGAGRRNRAIFVGRLSPEKNLGMAIKACRQCGIGLDIIGKGTERQRLEGIAQEVGADVAWLGVLANDELPQHLNRCRFFILPSLWEGMPKALLEGMACGLVCIGNNATGINEIIEDGVTGYLSAGPLAADLAEAIQRAMHGDYESVSAAARHYIDSHFSLAAIAGMEASIFAEMVQARVQQL